MSTSLSLSDDVRLIVIFSHIMNLMAGKLNDRSTRIKSFFENDIFLDELKKIKQIVKDENYDIEVIKLRRRWGLNWDYHETITHYLETNRIDYSLGDNDIRVIDYKAQELYPSDSPRDEFRVMDSLKDIRDKGVHIKLPKDLNKTTLLDFIKNNYSMIEEALNNNYPDRLPHQAPEQQTKRKVHIFRLHEEGVPVKDICELENCEPRYVREVVKEYKDKISS